MSKTSTATLFLIALVSAILISACAPTSPLTLQSPLPSPVSGGAGGEVATPTEEPAATGEPTVTPTSTLTPTPTITPTPLPVTMLTSCAEIWQPGYYKLANDVKTLHDVCFYVQSHNVVIDCDNHSIEGDNRRIEGKKYSGDGFLVQKFGFPVLAAPTNVEIKNCKVSHHRNGIYVGAGSNIYIHHNDLSNNFDDTNPQRSGIFLGDTEGGGIHLNSVDGARVENNTANNQAIGIDIRNSNHIIVRNNVTDRNSAWGISLFNTSNSEVSNNTARDNVRYCTWGDNQSFGRGCDAGGILLQDGSSHNVIRDNVVTGENGNGIFIKAHGYRCGDDNLIENNKIIDAIYNAVEFSFCKDNKVIGNEMSGSFDAVFFGFATNTEVRGNKINNMRNHGIISWNSRNSIVAENQIANSREGVYFYADTWDRKQYSFLPPSPDNYASRDNVISNNLLRQNAQAAIHLSNSIQNRVENNTFSYNERDIWLEGASDGNVIPMLTPTPTATPAPTQTPTATPTAPALTPTATPTAQP